MGRKLGWGLHPLWEGELGLHLTPCGHGQGLPACQVSSWSVKPFGTIHQRHRQTDRQDRTGQDRQTTVRLAQVEPFTNGRPKTLKFNKYCNGSKVTDGKQQKSFWVWILMTSVQAHLHNELWWTLEKYAASHFLLICHFILGKVFFTARRNARIASAVMVAWNWRRAVLSADASLLVYINDNWINWTK